MQRRFTRRGLLYRAEPPFKLSVMLWTVFQKLPIERRLERISAAGYRSVELVTEFTEWPDEDFRRINAKRRALGMVFDTMAGNGGYTSKLVGLTDPSERDGFLSDIRHGAGHRSEAGVLQHDCVFRQRCRRYAAQDAA